MDNHTPTPWKAIENNNMKHYKIEGSNGETLFNSIFDNYPNRENAEYIVKACNAYDNLVKEHDRLNRDLAKAIMVILTAQEHIKDGNSSEALKVLSGEGLYD